MLHNMGVGKMRNCGK